MAISGSLERSIMDVLWAADSPLLIRELLARINAAAPRPLAYTTVQTVADRLVHKGMLGRTLDGNAYRYAPATSRDEHVAALMLDALADAEDRGPALARFAQGMDPADARRLLIELAVRSGPPPDE